MNKELHATTNHAKQVSYAAYLVNLDTNRRMRLLEAMKPALREKMYCLINDLTAKNVAKMEPQVRSMYLSNLKRTNHVRYEEIYPKIAAYMFSATQPQKGVKHVFTTRPNY